MFSKDGHIFKIKTLVTCEKSFCFKHISKRGQCNYPRFFKKKLFIYVVKM